jgi:hypothetical protein
MSEFLNAALHSKESGLLSFKEQSWPDNAKIALLN